MKQTEIPGTKDPDRIPEVEDRLTAWLESKERARDASDAKKTAEHLLLVELTERGIDRYPYLDGASGKRRYFVADKTPKAKTVAAPSKKQETAGDRVDAVDRALDALVDAIPDGTTLEVRHGKQVARLAKADRVESRRVPRTAAHDTVADPFAATREKLH